MKIELENLPSETKTLQQIIATLSVENDSLQSKNTTLALEKDSLQSENLWLREQLKLLKAKRFGRSSEKLNSQIERKRQ